MRSGRRNTGRAGYVWWFGGLTCQNGRLFPGDFWEAVTNKVPVVVFFDGVVGRRCKKRGGLIFFLGEVLVVVVGLFFELLPNKKGFV